MSVVIEFVVEGSLDRLLQKSRINSVRDDCQYVNIRSRLTERDLLHIAVGVARGMCHLERKQVRILSCGKAFAEKYEVAVA